MQNNVLFQWNCFISVLFDRVYMWNEMLKQNTSRRGLSVNQKPCWVNEWITICLRSFATARGYDLDWEGHATVRGQ